MGIRGWTIGTLLIIGAAVGGAARALAAPGDVVISQVWGGVGTVGQSGAPKADYVELFNRTPNPIVLTGYSIAVATTSTSTTWAQHNITGTIQGFSYFLIRVSADGTVGGAIALPGVDDAFSGHPSALSGTHIGSSNGRAVLRDVTTPSMVGSGLACPPGNIVDLVAWGSTAATCREGGSQPGNASLVAPFNTPTRLAGGCTDTDVNGVDVVLAPANPHWSGNGSVGGCATGACCNPGTGACTSATVGGCGLGGGVYVGDGTVCPNAACAATGACCSGATATNCLVVTAAGCAGMVNGVYVGDGSVCVPTPCVAAACCFGDGTCCAVYSGMCAVRAGVAGTATTCAAATGGCLMTPGNDLCANPVALAVGVPVVGNTFAATFAGDGPTTPCLANVTQSSKGVWFAFTPPSTSNYDFSTCGTVFDCELTVFVVPDCGNAATWTVVGCDDDLCPAGAASFCGVTGSSLASMVQGLRLEAGVEYRVRLSTHGALANAGGNYSLMVSDVGGASVGACCFALNGACEVRTLSSCVGAAPAGTYQGDGSACAAASPCVGTYGACCFNGGVCVRRPASGCTGANVYKGDNVACVPDPCFSEACCNVNTGVCSLRTLGACSPSEAGQGVDTTCAPSPCPLQGACCNRCTFACSVALLANCAAATSGWVQGGVCTVPNSCLVGAVPANDSPCDAIPLVSGVSQSGTLFTATSAGDGLNASCDLGASKGVWYRFTPGAGAGGEYSVSTCGSTFGTCVTVMSGDCESPDSMAMVACDDDTCVGGASGEPVVCGTGVSSVAAAIVSRVTLAEGTTYFVRVQADAGAPTGAGTFTVVVMPVQGGSCCTSAGVCTDTIQTLCTGSSVFQLGASCWASACQNAGACCDRGTLACVYVLATQCDLGTSVYRGGGSTCAPNSCVVNDACPGPGLVPGVMALGTTVGATGNTAASCSINCPDTWWEFAAPFGDTYVFTMEQLSGGDPVVSVFTECSQGSGTELGCVSGGRLAPPQTVVSLGVALAAGQVVRVRCSSYSCVAGPYTLVVHSTQTGGVCCRGATCSTVFASAGACAAAVDSTSPVASAKFVAGAALCNVPVSTPGSLGNAISPCCFANYNHNATVEIQDIFDFLSDWFGGKRAAVFGGDGTSGTLQIQNIFDFLNAWFSGGCT